MNAVTISREGDVTRITMNRPEKLNAFNEDLVDGLLDAVTQAESDGCRLVVFEGAGKGFSGGFDLGGIDDLSDGDLLLRFVRVEQVLQAVYHASFATLALVQGACYGAAAELVAACQWRVATPDARFRMPGSRFGIVLGTRRLATVVGADTARRLLLRDTPFTADLGLDAGYLTELAAQDAWAEVTHRIRAEVTALDPATFAALSARQVTDTRDVDMATLVASATRGSVKNRITAYLAEMTAARKGG